MEKLTTKEIREIVDPDGNPIGNVKTNVYEGNCNWTVFWMSYMNNLTYAYLNISKLDSNVREFAYFARPCNHPWDDKFDKRLAEIVDLNCSYKNELGYFFENDDQIRKILRTFTEYINAELI